MEHGTSAEAEAKRRCELAWAAGFFDGEGWAGASRPKGRRTAQPSAQINQASAEGVPEVLLRFQKAVGVGRIGGPVLVKNREPLYRWGASSRGDVARVFEQLAPWLGALKRAQFAAATGENHVPTFQRSNSAERIAWACGLFDGEGCTSLAEHASHSGYHAIEMAVTQGSPNGRPEVLERFEAIVGRGKVYGPYQGEGRKAVYRWKAYGLENVLSVLHALGPWLDVVKRHQAVRALDVLYSEPQLPRGNVLWGSHKTHCVHGHEYAAARLRAYRPRSDLGVQRRASKQCLACSREQARARRAAKKS